LQAAALRDVITTLRRRAPTVALIVYPVPVQGSDAGVRIARMFGVLAQRREVDVVLLVRGGGSIEDLWAFNEEVVARAVRACPLPVVVGVGHESDVTIADFVADVRAPTPTAAAELVAPDQAALAHLVHERYQRLARACRSVIDQRAQRIDHARRLLASPQSSLLGLRNRLAALVARARREAIARVLRHRERQHHSVWRLQRVAPDRAALRAEVLGRLQRAQRSALREAAARQERLRALQRALYHLDSQRVLERGFAILRDEQGVVVRSAAMVPVHAPLSAQLIDGTLHVKVMGIAKTALPEPIESPPESSPSP
jgi:exodeoxyribonuclease VII large subunit